MCVEIFRRDAFYLLQLLRPGVPGECQEGEEDAAPFVCCKRVGVVTRFPGQEETHSGGDRCGEGGEQQQGVVLFSEQESLRDEQDRGHGDHRRCKVRLAPLAGRGGRAKRSG